MTDNEDTLKKGFGGLSSLATDSEKADDHSEVEDSDVSDISTSPTSVPEEQKIYTAERSSGRSGSPVLWFLGIIGVLILIGVFSNQGEKSQNSARRPTTTNLPAPVPKHITPPPNPPIKTQQPEITFEKPPTGSNLVLTISQIRWCLREEIRLEAMRDLLVTNEAITEFNRLIEDYNRRAGSYRYAPGTLEQARRDVEDLRAAIVKKARTDAAVLGKSSAPKPNKVIDNISEKKQPTEINDFKRTEADARGSEPPQKSDNTRSSSNSYYTRGSHQSEVLRLQGTPSSIQEFSGEEWWYYGSSKVTISKSSRTVKAWDDYGNLKVRYIPTGTTGTSPYYTRGSSQDEVLRLQGTPSSIQEFSGEEWWYYGSSKVTISKSSRTVKAWDDYGNLKVR